MYRFGPSRRPVMFVTAARVGLVQTLGQRWFMPILFMGLIALGVFMGMGLMLFYAAYCEVKQAHQPPQPPQPIRRS
jgi:hypothetical protein